MLNKILHRAPIGSIGYCCKRFEESENWARCDGREIMFMGELTRMPTIEDIECFCGHPGCTQHYYLKIKQEGVDNGS